MGELGVEHFLFLSAALFIIGMMGVLIRRNLLIIFMCVEMMVTAAPARGWRRFDLRGLGVEVRGFEPLASSVRVISGSPPCRPAFP